VADEEALAVVIRVDEPAGNALGAVAANFASLGVEDIHTIDLHPNFPIFFWKDCDIRLAEDDEEVPFC
jgi:hypothetical protein